MSKAPDKMYVRPIRKGMVNPYGGWEADEFKKEGDIPYVPESLLKQKDEEIERLIKEITSTGYHKMYVNDVVKILKSLKT